MEEMEQPPPLAPDAHEDRDWARLPFPALKDIFCKVGCIRVMMAVQFVCRSWRELSLESHMWRVVDMTSFRDDMRRSDLIEMAMEAIDRSQGLMEEFSAKYFVDDALIEYIADNTRQLKRFSLIACNRVTEYTLIDFVKQFPMLEEIGVTRCYVSEQLIEEAGKSCLHLKCFRYNVEWFSKKDTERILDMKKATMGEDWDDWEAFAVSKNMKELQELQMFGNAMSKVGLNAILDKCQKLDTLDIMCCRNVEVDGSLQRRCAMIKKLKLPDDPSAYEHEDELTFLYLSDSGSDEDPNE